MHGTSLLERERGKRKGTLYRELEADLAKQWPGHKIGGATNMHCYILFTFQFKQHLSVQSIILIFIFY